MDIEEINKLFYYDETSPSGLRWNQDRYSGRYGNILKVKFGDVAGSQSNTGHYSVRVNKKLTKCHRIVFVLNGGHIPEGFVVDHIDGNPSNNNIGNLRAIPQKVNCRNRKVSKKNTTGISGIRECRNRKHPEILDGYVVGWRDPVDSKPTTKEFLFKNYGLFAFEYACEFRMKLFQEFNDNGAGYSERHISSKPN